MNKFMNKFRVLNAEEIEVRIGQKVGKDQGVTLLLYKDSRVDMNLLDETVGAENWERLHTRDNQNCTVSIWDTEKQLWVSKEDTGTESNTEKEKGLASDSFKRACVNWGIGRELYTAPKIIVWGNPEELKKKTFSVKEISYNDKREISSLTIVDEKGVEVFSTNKKQVQPQSKQEVKKTESPKSTQESKKISEAQRKRIFAIAGHGNDLVIREVIEQFGYESTADILVKDYEEICAKLEAKINKG